MEKMREMIHQNASGTVELASSAEQLSSQADKFQQIVGKFILDGSEGTAGFQRKKKPEKHDGGHGSANKTIENEFHARVA